MGYVRIIGRALLCTTLMFAPTIGAAGNVEDASVAPPRPADGLDAETTRNIAALDCRHVVASDVDRWLARGPAPRIILLQGSFAPVTMEPFAQFLIAMGYPAARIRNPLDGRLSEGSFGDSLPWAGALAWYYEAEGMMPMLIGHSQGGMMAIRILYELNGAFNDAIPVWNPMLGAAESRTTIRDPLTGVTRPAKGLAVGYAAAIATGKLPRILFGQWDMIARLRRIPDTVDEFTGFLIPWDPIAGTLGEPEPYVATGTASVRNVTLPSNTSHIRIPETPALAANAMTRAWIDRYSPDVAPRVPDDVPVDTANLLHAADIWYSVKEHWCKSAQQLLLARKPP